jgi:AAA+ superfamily predicted ATPase
MKVDERVMIDSEHFYCNTEEGRELAPKLGISDSENYNGDDDGFSSFRRYRSSYSTAPDNFERASKCESSKSPYRGFDNIDPAKDQLSDLQLSLCRTRVWGFVLSNRKWEQLSVRCIEPPQFRDKLIDDLIIDDELKKMIQSLAKSYTSGTGRWSADFIQDKGEGQILLLHGKPGVGKTTTAECVAELMGRPLLPLTCGDLGIEPLKVEENLMKWFKVGARWEAIILIDEAEVYLEARETTDLQRNSLVSIFLRALDYYKGILFLTTNRVGTFDDAFVSRIHLIVHYPDFSGAGRGRVWQKFFSKLSKDRPNIRVDDGARYYAMKSDEVKNLGWNGREIRNAFSTAVALAEDEDQRDADNKIMLYEHHLRPVVKMSAKFKEKFKDIQGMNEEQLAKRKYLRSEAEVSDEILKGKKHSIDSTMGSEIYNRAHNDGQHSKRLRA